MTPKTSPRTAALRRVWRRAMTVFLLVAMTAPLTSQERDPLLDAEGLLAVTGPATDVTTSAATLNGVVNADGRPTGIIFEYGTSVALGDTALATPDSLFNLIDTPVSTRLTGLASGAQLFFRVSARNDTGLTITGTIDSFRVNRAPLVSNPLDDRRATLGEGTVFINLLTPPVFSDPDGDTLSFAVSSSDPAVAVGGILSDSLLALSFNGPGSATITVQADDGRRGTAVESFAVTVNRAPEVTNPVADALLAVGDSLVRDLLAPPVVFSDPDGDALNVSAVSDDPAIASVSTTGSVLTVRMLTAGTTTVRLTAADPDGATASDAFQVTGNTAPRSDQPLPDTSLTIGGNATLNLAGYFSDPDGDPLTFEALSSDPDAVLATILQDSLLRIAALSGTGATVSVTARDGNGGVVADAFVVSLNGAPRVVNPIADQTLRIGQSFRRTLTASPPVFDDPDGDPLAFAALSRDPGIASVTLLNGELTVTLQSLGGTTVLVTATDPSGAAAIDSFRVSSNRPPVVAAPIPDDTLLVGGAALELNLAVVFRDDDGDSLRFTASSSDPTFVLAAVISDSLLRVQAVDGGLVSVAVRAIDPQGGSVSDTFRVTANTPPLVSNPLPDRQLLVGDSTVRDLNAAPAVFRDDDGDALQYEAVSSNPAVASVRLDGSVLTVILLQDSDATITVTARDGVGGEVSTAFVVSTNRAPRVVLSIPDQVLTFGGQPYRIDLSTVFVDDDGDPLTFAVSADDPGVASASLQGTQLQVSAVGGGVTIVRASASDPDGATALDAFQVTVNRPPVVANAIADQVLLPGNTLAIPLANPARPVFSDPDGDVLAFSDSSDAPGSTTTEIRNDTLFVSTSQAAASTVFVRADDGRGGSVSDAFVVSPNAPPLLVTPLADDTLRVNGAPRQTLLGTVFSDPGDTLVFTATAANPDVAGVSLGGDTLSVFPNRAGITNIRVAASDQRGGVTRDTFRVVINTPPLVNGGILSDPLTVTVGGAPFTIAVGDLFTESDTLTGDALAAVSGSSADPTVAVVTVDADSISVAAAGEGQTTARFAAYDLRGDSVVTAVTVRGNQPPERIAAIPDDTLRLDGPAAVIDLNAYFSDPTDPLVFAVSVSDPAVISGAVDGDGRLSLFPQGPGRTTVAVSAADGRGGIAGDTLTVLVNAPPLYRQGALPDPLVATIDAPPVRLPLAGAFADPDSLDGDRVTRWLVESANPGIVRAQIEGDTLVLEAFTGGTTTLRLAAFDTRDDSLLLVLPARANRAPEVASLLPDTILTRGGSPLVRDLESQPRVFVDPDGEALSYAATSGDTSVARVELANGTVLRVISGDVQGQSTDVIVTASDAAGATVVAEFSVAVTSGPFVANGLADTVVTINNTTAIVLIDLETPRRFVFRHPDPQVRLAYSARSDVDLVSATVSQDSLIVTAQVDTAADITVTARDGRGGSVDNTFRFIVNQQPVLAAPLPDTLVAVTAGKPCGLRLSDFFRDNDGDPLTYDAVSSVPGRIAAAVSGDSLVLTAVGDTGRVAIAVSVSDGQGGRLEDSFSAVINRAPQPVAGRAIADTVLTIGGQTFGYDLADPDTRLFTDPDGNPLRYVAASSHPDVAVAVPVGSRLTVTPGSVEGVATITLTAVDGKGGRTATDFEVAVNRNRPPRIVLDTSLVREGVQVGQVAVIRARVTKREPGVDIDSVNLYYRTGGTRLFHQVRMSRLDDDFQGAIPAGAVTASGVEFYLEAIDDLDSLSRRPGGDTLSFSFPVILPTGVTSTVSIAGGAGPEGYRLISVPLDLLDKRPAAVIGDDFGEYDDSQWRFLHLREDGSYQDFPGDSVMVPGRSFWLLSREPRGAYDTGPGSTVNVNAPYRIPLHAGWNLVANPFTFPVPVSGVVLTASTGPLAAGIDVGLRAFEGGWLLPETVTELTPFTGYAVYVDPSEMPAVLTIEPDPVGELERRRAAGTDSLWALALEVRMGDWRDDDTRIGFAVGAEETWDRRDLPEPPAVGGTISMAVVNADWNRGTERFATDYRPMADAGGEWQLDIRGQESDRAVVRALNGDSLPDGYQAWLVDPVSGAMVNLRDTPEYAVAVRGPGHATRLQVIMGSADYVSDRLKGLLPTAYDLFPNYPNPFNPSTTIRFALPAPARVTLNVYNVLGQRVVALADKADYAAGYHTLVWDGRNERGQAVSSGVYFFRMSTGDWARTRKMILLE